MNSPRFEVSVEGLRQRCHLFLTPFYLCIYEVDTGQYHMALSLGTHAISIFQEFYKPREINLTYVLPGQNPAVIKLTFRDVYDVNMFLRMVRRLGKDKVDELLVRYHIDQSTGQVTTYYIAGETEEERDNFRRTHPHLRGLNLILMGDLVMDGRELSQPFTLLRFIPQPNTIQLRYIG